MPRRVFLAACAVLAVCPPVLGAEDRAELDVMSFNIRYAREGHSENASHDNWNDAEHPRRERVARVIRENLPDIFGVQEAYQWQIDYLKESFPEFDYYGAGRDDGKERGEQSGIFFQRDRFELEDSGTFWLSNTPDTPGTTFAPEANALPRIASWAKLKDKESGHRFIVLNSHWDHVSVPAREKAPGLIRKRLAEIAPDLPKIVMGDLNSHEDMKQVVELIGEADGGGLHLVDAYRKLHPERRRDEASFGAFKGTVRGSRIDFIVATPDLEPTKAAIIRTNYDGLWPSDHYPVTARFLLPTVP